MYLAGAIDGATEDGAKSWRDTAAVSLSHSNIGSFSPAHAFTLPPKVLEDERACSQIIYVNMGAILSATAVLADLSKPTFGTPLEMTAAHERGIPVFAFGGARNSIYRHAFQSWNEDIQGAVGALLNWWDLG